MDEEKTRQATIAQIIKEELEAAADRIRDRVGYRLSIGFADALDYQRQFLQYLATQSQPPPPVD